LRKKSAILVTFPTELFLCWGNSYGLLGILGFKGIRTGNELNASIHAFPSFTNRGADSVFSFLFPPGESHFIKDLPESQWCLGVWGEEARAQKYYPPDLPW
jgi:hypothetical protein